MRTGPNGRCVGGLTYENTQFKGTLFLRHGNPLLLNLNGHPHNNILALTELIIKQKKPTKHKKCWHKGQMVML